MKILIFTMLLLGVNSAWGQTKITEYEYIALPYTLDALEPSISQRTMALHYGKHLRAYVDNLNRLIKNSVM
jgi:Fe-Mn family superoxide dismutase